MEAPSIRRSRTLLLTAATVTADLGSRRDRTGRTHEFRARPVDAPEVASPRGRSASRTFPASHWQRRRGFPGAARRARVAAAGLGVLEDLQESTRALHRRHRCVVLQLAEPRVGSGVWQYTAFRQHPLERLQRTGHAAMMTVYGPRSRTEQMIAGVTCLHARVRGTAPDGEPSARAIPSFSSGCMRPPASDLSRRITPTYGRSHWSSAIGSSRRVCRRQSSTAPAPYRNRSQHSKPCSLE